MTDVVVIGGGIDGLAAAALIARRGRGVVLVEGRDRLGGLAAAEEFHPGFRAPGVLHDASGTRRGLLEPLRLEQHGLRWRAEATPLLVADGDRGLLLQRDPERMGGELDAADAAAYGAWRSALEPFRDLVCRILDERPPSFRPRAPRDLLQLGRTGVGLRRLGERNMLELLRIAPMCAADWMDEHLSNDRLVAGLVAPALLGTHVGPRAAGTGALLLLAQCAAGVEPEGGPSALSQALVEACRAGGVELRTGSAATEISVQGGAVSGVVLEGGERIEAATILSSIGFGHTMLELLPPPALPLDLEQAARTWRSRGAVACVRLALDAPPAFAGRGGEPIERAITAADLRGLERAADHLKYGRLPRRPWLDVRIPTVADPSLAPPGRAVVTLLVPCVPHDLAGGWDDGARGRLETAVLDELERVAPGTREAILGREVLSPRDLAERHALDGGNLFRGEPALDQLWFQRPALSCARHGTPVPGLFLAGRGSHPGCGFLGGSGALAAAAVLET